MTTEVDLLNTIHEYADMGLSGLNQVIPLSSDRPLPESSSIRKAVTRRPSRKAKPFWKSATSLGEKKPALWPK